MKNMSPFNGDFYGSNGNIRNLLKTGQPAGRTPKDSMSPFSGFFYASDGSIHNLDEFLELLESLSTGGTGGTGEGVTLEIQGAHTGSTPPADTQKLWIEFE